VAGNAGFRGRNIEAQPDATRFAEVSNSELIKRLAGSRKRLAESLNYNHSIRKEAEEGGCGVVGFCCSEPVAGKHIYEPSRQMHNRGNGKGGGIAAVGLVPEQLGVSREVLDTHFLLHVAFIDTKVRPEIEAQFITPFFDVAAFAQLDKVDDWKSVPGLEVLPPDVCRYFVRVKPLVLDAFIAKNHLQQLDRSEAEDEFVNQNSFNLNQKYYASLGEKRAFVLSHGRDIMILKVVGYAEAIVKYYKIEEFCAHEWIAHQRFPTKGRVWHPGGAHPFAAIDMALVHNGDFANYHSVTEYLNSARSFRSSSPTRRFPRCCSTCSPAPTIIRWSTSSRRWRPPRNWTSTGSIRRSKRFTGPSKPLISTVRPTAHGFSSSPATCFGNANSS